MAWRPAYSLQTLKDQLDSTYPGWLFLGFLGDQAHASVPSDHNPNAQGVVCALDIGPGGGLDIHGLADKLAADPHPDLKYIISNRRIAEREFGFNWRTYSGSDPHDTHIHVSVGVGPDGQSRQPYDDRVQWNINGGSMADEQTRAKRIGDIFKGMTGKDISQKDLDFYISRPEGEIDLIYALLPQSQKYRDTIKVLEDERDNVLYPYVNAVSAVLNITPDARKLTTVTDAIKNRGGTAQEKLDQIKKIVN